MDLVINRFTVSILVVGCLVAWFLQLIALSPISPNPLILKHSYTREGPYAKNNVLQAVEKLGEGMLDRPEDTAVDSQGLIYSQGWLDKTYAFKWVMGRLEDGWRRSSRPYCKHEWRCSCLYAQPDYVFNMRIDTLQIQDIQLLAEKLMEMHIKLGFKWVFATVRLRLMSLVFIRHIILQGLLKVNDDQLFLLASKIDGVPIRFANTVVEASDGSVYFSDSSTKYEKFFLDLLEAKPYGRLLKYDPITKKTTVLLDGLGFANGVALSSKEDYIIICETWKFRCLKHWIKGEKLGSTEIFIENLPGGPDNINIAADGRSYWIALVGIWDFEAYIRDISQSFGMDWISEEAGYGGEGRRARTTHHKFGRFQWEGYVISYVCDGGGRLSLPGQPPRQFSWPIKCR